MLNPSDVRLMMAPEGKIATAEDAARVDADPPLDQLMRLLKEGSPKVDSGESVVYWMRMEDMRSELILEDRCEYQLSQVVEDNTALAKASKCAKDLKIPLVTLFVLSPGDYKWHDRSSRRIDFMLRNLRYLKVSSLDRVQTERVLTLNSRGSLMN